MGMVVGEKIARLCERALEDGLPVILFACSGGARMHEGAVSLMQMAKTCGALQRLHAAGGVSISVMTHPTTGGVTASFASVCDFLIAEPGALIGFAGPRVIATTIKKELPKGFQRSEFLLEKGQIDFIVDRAAYDVTVRATDDVEVVPKGAPSLYPPLFTLELAVNVGVEGVDDGIAYKVGAPP